MGDATQTGRPNRRAIDRRGLRVLSSEECLTRVRETPMGRVGFALNGRIAILPVNHVLDGTDVAFRTSWGSKLQLAADLAQVAFEVDGHGPGSGSGWSVLVQGTARLVDGGEDRRHLDTLAADPWVPFDENTFWVRIRTEDVSGREILRD